MSKHWNPDEELAWLAAADEPARPVKGSWPEGATAGLLLVACSCLAVGAVLYSFAGPRLIIEEAAAPR